MIEHAGVRKVLEMALLCAGLAILPPQAVAEDRFVPFSGAIEGVTGQVLLVARIFDAAEGGAEIWGAEAHPLLLDDGGRFSVVLGTSLQDFRNEWLEIEQGGDGIPDLNEIPAGKVALFLELEVQRQGDRQTLSPRYPLEGSLLANTAGIAFTVRPGGVTAGMFGLRSVDGSALASGAIQGRHIERGAITDDLITTSGLTRIAEGAVQDCRPEEGCPDHIQGFIRNYHVGGNHFGSGEDQIPIKTEHLGVEVERKCTTVREPSSGTCPFNTHCYTTATCPTGSQVVSGGCLGGSLGVGIGGSGPAPSGEGWRCRGNGSDPEARARCCSFQLVDKE